ncbi:hypothetical protein [Lysobacter sp. CA199]|uniref:hypothetical protein n=1 Tax=Lysobacter sp. CA199 TaxID=3455608 RepID=UPI003F8D5978
MRSALGARWASIAALALALSACDRPASDAQNPAPTVTKQPSATNAVAADAADKARPTLAPIADYVLPGALAPDLGPEQLRQLFGAANVAIDERLNGAEGEQFRGVIVYPQDSTRRAYLYFQDEQNLRGLSTVTVRDRDTRWRLDTGLRMGMPLAELARLNGKPIRFSGLDWDYGGVVDDWNGGKLAGDGSAAVMRHARLGYTGETALQPGDFPVGDSAFSSADRRYPKQGRLLTVVEFGISLPGEDDL